MARTITAEAVPKVDVVALGKVIAHLRESRGISQEELAQAVGLTQPTLSRFERGGGQPDALALHRLAGVLGVTVDEIHRLVEATVERAAELAETATQRKSTSDAWWTAAAAVLGVVGVVMLVGVAVAAVFGASKTGRS